MVVRLPRRAIGSVVNCPICSQALEGGELVMVCNAVPQGARRRPQRRRDRRVPCADSAELLAPTRRRRSPASARTRPTSARGAASSRRRSRSCSAAAASRCATSACRCAATSSTPSSATTGDRVAVETRSRRGSVRWFARAGRAPAVLKHRGWGLGTVGWFARAGRVPRVNRQCRQGSFARVGRGPRCPSTEPRSREAAKPRGREAAAEAREAQ